MTVAETGWPDVRRGVLAKVTDPLSQVWFVHDYVQLQCQYTTSKSSNVLRLDRPGGRSIRQGEPDFRDARVALIDGRLVDLEDRPHDVFVLRFDDGTDLCVCMDEASRRGPEAAELPGAVLIFDGEV